MKWTRYEILLPQRYNDHRPIEEEKFDQTNLELVAKFSSTRRGRTKVKKIIQVHIYRGDSYYVAECIDLPVVTQGRTLDELAANLREAIALHLEGEDLSALGLR